MPNTIIPANPTTKRPKPESGGILNVAEFFSDTISGEGVSVGCPATFLRVQGCSLACHWCDTTEVWRQGNPYTYKELSDLIAAQPGLIDRLYKGQHLILTGGSPLKQQENLVAFLENFIEAFEFKPYIEVENEAVIMPSKAMIELVDQWNNSPKLENSAMPRKARYKPDVLGYMAMLRNSWFKFVISDPEKDWAEIETDFISADEMNGTCQRDKIILMPCGATQEELNKTRENVVNLAIREGVRFTDRLHVTIWDRAVSV